MITITGATGNTGSKIADLLLKEKESVKVVGRNSDKLSSLKLRGAELFIGDQSDAGFLTRAFKGADAVYLLIPPSFNTENVRDYYNSLGDVAVEAVRASGVKRVVFLSSLGADQESGTGPVLGLHDVELKLKKLNNVHIAILRPGYFMENTLGTLGLIKEKGMNGSPGDPEKPINMIATRDIAQKAAELLIKRSFTGHSVVDLFGDRLSYSQVTSTIGAKMGKPDLPHIRFSDADAIGSFKAMGLSQSVAESYVELSHAIAQGRVVPKTIGADAPNTPTRYAQFVEDVMAPLMGLK